MASPRNTKLVPAAKGKAAKSAAPTVATAALRPTLIRAELAAWRRELLALGRDAAARRLTALIADFDYLSRGLSRG